MNSTINSIIQSISGAVNRQKSLLSLSLVGSFFNSAKELEFSNDLDLVLVYDELSQKVFSELKTLAEQIKNKYSSDNLKIGYTFKIGPVKSFEKSRNLLIHFLVYSKKSYLKYSSRLTRYSFQHYPALLGCSLSEISRSNSVSTRDLFNKIDGIPALKSRISNKSVLYIEPVNNGFKIAKEKLTDESHLEIVFHSTLWLANNILRVFKEYYSDVSLDMCERFNEKIPINMRDFPLRAYEYKQKMHNNAKITGKDAAKIKADAMRFVSECESYLRNNLSKS
jgi:hypothetical protein